MNLSFYYWPDTQIQWSERTGLNAKQVLILSCSSANSTNTEFLQKILTAISLDLSKDVHLISTAESVQTQLTADPKLNEYKTVVLFGFQPSQIGITCGQVPVCSVFYFENFTCIAAPALEKIERDPGHKKALWAILRQVFPNHS